MKVEQTVVVPAAVIQTEASVAVHTSDASAAALQIDKVPDAITSTPTSEPSHANEIVATEAASQNEPATAVIVAVEEPCPHCAAEDAITTSVTAPVSDAPSTAAQDTISEPAPTASDATAAAGTDNSQVAVEEPCPHCASEESSIAVATTPAAIDANISHESQPESDVVVTPSEQAEAVATETQSSEQESIDVQLSAALVKVAELIEVVHKQEEALAQLEQNATDALKVCMLDCMV